MSFPIAKSGWRYRQAFAAYATEPEWAKMPIRAYRLLTIDACGVSFDLAAVQAEIDRLREYGYSLEGGPTKAAWSHAQRQMASWLRQIGDCLRRRMSLRSVYRSDMRVHGRAGCIFTAR